jgi:hypothetical protein
MPALANDPPRLERFANGRDRTTKTPSHSHKFLMPLAWRAAFGPTGARVAPGARGR